MDRLEEVFKMQKRLNKEIIERRHLEDVSNETWIQKHMMAMFVEMGEAMNELNYKWWKNEKAVDEDALKEELIDILHFYISMCIDAKMDANELFQRYMEKNRENHLRQEGKSQKSGYQYIEKKWPIVKSS